jgi:hypothetical protein
VAGGWLFTNRIRVRTGTGVWAVGEFDAEVTVFAISACISDKFLSDLFKNFLPNA